MATKISLIDTFYASTRTPTMSRYQARTPRLRSAPHKRCECGYPCDVSERLVHSSNAKLRVVIRRYELCFAAQVY